jgi:hypothetical protein
MRAVTLPRYLIAVLICSTTETVAQELSTPATAAFMTGCPPAVAVRQPTNAGTPALPPENSAVVSTVEVKRIPFGRAQEELFLTLSAQRLLDQCSLTCESAADSPEAKELVARSRTLRDYVRQKNYDVRLSDVLNVIPGLLSAMQAEAAMRRRQMQEHADDVRKTTRDRRESSKRNSFNVLQGTWLLMLGNLPLYSNRCDPITRATLTVETGTLSPAMSEFGMNTLMMGLSQGLADQERFAAAESIGEIVLRRVVEHSYNRQHELVVREQPVIDLLLKRQLGGNSLPSLPSLDRPIRKLDERVERTPEPPRRLSDALRERPPTKAPSPPPGQHPRPATDFLPLLDAQRQRAELLRQYLKTDEPYSVAAWHALYSTTQVSASKRAEEWFAQGQKIANLAGQFPDADIYDDDRAAILGIAADLILRAAMLDTRRASWITVHDRKAETALELLEAALRLKPSDPTGVLREQQASACAVTGRWRKAYAVAASLRVIRGDSQRFRFLLARLAFLNGQPDESLAELSFAMERLGLSDINAVRTCVDLPRQDTRFRNLTTIEVDAISHSVVSGGTVQIVNRSAFPLTDAKFELKYPLRKGSATTQLFVAFLPPGEECEISYAPRYAATLLPAGSGNQNRGKLTLNCDQGTKTVNVK